MDDSDSDMHTTEYHGAFGICLPHPQGKCKNIPWHKMSYGNVKHEYDIMRQLSNCKNIVRVIAFITNEQMGMWQIVMEDGGHDLYRRRPDPTDARNVVEQVLRGLECMHKLSIAHRDIKLENVLRKVDGTVRLCDFGLAVSFPHNAPAICTKPVGSRAYVSPEAWRFRPFDPFASDVWAVGIVLYALSRQGMPFPSSDGSDTRFGRYRLMCADGTLETALTPCEGFEKMYTSRFTQPQLSEWERETLNKTLQIDPESRMTFRP